MNYYNENNRHMAAWLRELIVQGVIPEGVVDERSIVEVKAKDLKGFTQCHFFAGVGGWPIALQLAGWPKERPIWTGSCPCQSFSAAGKRKGAQDERHLWPYFFRLIEKCSPVAILGEQVAAAIRYGWLDGVQADLESKSYTVGSAVLGAHSVGSPHKRNRLYWVADGYSSHVCIRKEAKRKAESVRAMSAFRLAFPSGRRRQAAGVQAEQWQAGKRKANERRDAARLAIHTGNTGRRKPAAVHQAKESGDTPWFINGFEYIRSANGGDVAGVSDAQGVGYQGAGKRQYKKANGNNGGRQFEFRGFWDGYEVINFEDGAKRRSKPGVRCLAHGVHRRTHKVHGYGNAIVPQTAAAFITAWMQAQGL